MIFLSILIFILAMSLPSVKNQITPIFFTRITALVFIYAGALSFNVLYIQSIGSGIGFYSGLFQISSYNLLIETFLYFIASIILLSWPLLYFRPFTLRLGEERGLLEGQVQQLSLDESRLKKMCGSVKYLPFVKEIDNSSTDSENTKNINISKYYPARLSAEQDAESNLILPDTFKNNNTNSLKSFISISTAKPTILIPLKESIHYSLLVLFSTLGASLLISSGDLLSMYLSIELQSFALYILATIYRDSESATSAGLKYFLLGGLSSCLILLGIAILYTSTGLTNFESINSLISILDLSPLKVSELGHIITSNNIDVHSEELTIVNTLDPITSLNYETNTYQNINTITQGISAGLILIVVGFLFKIAGAPFHNWAPDVYDDSPTNVTIWLTIMPKISIIFFLLELIIGIALNLSDPITSLNTTSVQFLNLYDSYLQVNINNGLSIIKNIFLFSSFLSLIIGTVVGLAQVRIKRLLAYSTISHIGFILLVISITTESSTESLIFYVIQYTLTNLNTFLILLALGYILNSFMYGKSIGFTTLKYINSDIKFIFTLRGLFLSNPILSLSLVICLFSMAGIPPLIGFFGKQSVLLSAIGNGYYFMSFVAILVSVISASYYLRIIKELHSETDANSDKVNVEAKPEPAKNISDVKMLRKNTNSLLISDTAVLELSKESRQDSKLLNILYQPHLKGVHLSDSLTIENNISILDDKNKKLNNDFNRIIDISLLSKEEIYSLRNQDKDFLTSRSPKNNLGYATYFSITNIHSFFISILTLSILFYVLKPSILLNSVILSTLSLFSL